MSTSAARAFAPEDPWILSARAAIVELASGALSLTCTCGDLVPFPEGMAGALVPIVATGSPPFQVGLFASDDGCAAIARALLGFSPSDKLSRADVVDAVNEVVNMLSGNVKARIPGYATHAALGLPTFIHGPVEHSRAQQVIALSVSMGPIEAWVVVLRSSN